jgi:hypothetical protein
MLGGSHSRTLPPGRNSASLAGVQASGPWQASSTRGFVEKSPGLALLAGALVLAAISTLWLLLQAPDFFTGYDFMRMHFFYKTYYREALLSGRLPLWNPYVGLGRPFMADIETAALYPPNLLVLPLGIYAGTAACLLLHQTLAIYGGARLGRTLGASAGASWIVGAGIALSSPFTARLDVGIVEGYYSLCWLPALLWLGASLQDRWQPRIAAGFAGAVGLTILAGQPPLAYVEFLGLLVFLALRISWRRGSDGGSGPLRPTLRLAAFGLLGVGISAAALLPFLELVGQGNRPLNSAGFAVANGMPGPSWLSLIILTSASFRPNWEYGLHSGLVPFFAALSGVLLVRDRNVRALAGMGLVGALLAAGDRLPLLGWVTHFTPGAGALRIPSRYGILLSTSILGIGAVSLSRRPALALPLLGFTLAASLAGVAWLQPHVVSGPGAAGFYLIQGGPLVIAAALVALWQRRASAESPGRALPVALAAFCAANWLWEIHLQAPIYSQYGFATDDSAVRAALENEGLYGAHGVPPRVSYLPVNVRENAGMTQGFSGYGSYVAPSLARTWGYLHAATGTAASASDFIRLPSDVYGRPETLDGINLAAIYNSESRTLAVRENPDPRAYLAFQAEAVPDWTTAEERMAKRWDFHSRPLVEDASVPALVAADGTASSASAVITDFQPERVSLRTTSSVPAILVLAEAWYPGWRASVGGKTVTVFPVNGWMRGVAVPAGENDVVFTFHSRWLGAGAAVSLASAAIALAFLLRRRTPQTLSSSL